MSWNTTLFMLLNAPERPSGLVWLAVNVAAIGPVILAPALLACLWIWGTPHRRPALIATASGVFFGQGVNWLLGLAWYEPRPFMAGIGHTWLAHAPDNGFPSDHATLGWSLGLGLALRSFPRLGHRSLPCSSDRRLVACLPGRPFSPGRIDVRPGRFGRGARRTPAVAGGSLDHSATRVLVQSSVCAFTGLAREAAPPGASSISAARAAARRRAMSSERA